MNTSNKGSLKTVGHHARLTALAAMLDISGQVIMGQRAFVRELNPEEHRKWNSLVTKTQISYIVFVLIMAAAIMAAVALEASLAVNVLAAILIVTIISSPVALVILQRKIWLK